MTLHNRANYTRFGRELTEQEIKFVSGGCGTDNPPELPNSGNGSVSANGGEVVAINAAKSIHTSDQAPTIEDIPSPNCPSDSPPAPE